ncbi:MAG: DUF1501 domain-containing protein [Phycisphaerales bacterium]|nr:DUF1501 domain-containing protein [Phycisphaerales bacterium]
MHETRAWTRRRFLQDGLVLASAAATLPLFLQRSAFALAPSGAPGTPDERVLVVVQLSGGNDGLNTVIPFGQNAYYNARRGIAIAQSETHVLDRQHGIGLHPAMGDLKSLYDDGLLGIVQGVGYPNPDRSHFTSMDVWHTASTESRRAGWLGRYFDAQCAGSPRNDATQLVASPLSGVALGRRAPLAMEGKQYQPIAFEDPRLLAWAGGAQNADLADAYGHMLPQAPASDDESPDAFLTRTALDAQVSSEAIRAAVANRPGASYPRSPLGQQLAMVASMVHAELPTRVYYVSMSGFDTHAAQGGAAGQHANLLRRFAEAIRAFYSDLRAMGQDGRVLTMVFSEFGRRVAQNASNGTDHGAAAPMFLLGPMVRAGVLSEHPSLTDLDDGDLKFRVDFRSVYATVLDTWLKADANAVLGQRFVRAQVLRRG